jgi:uncharacterized membrane protein
MSTTARLDAFTDAAFAFAVTLMVVGSGTGTPDYPALMQAVRSAPSFAIGFAIIAMFWWSHVRWRALRGDGNWRSVVLTLLLVFTVLVYVHPLRAMAASFATFLGGQADGFGGYLGEMFQLYGLGFILMCLITAALFHDAMRSHARGSAGRREAKGQAIIWTILLATGLVSIVLTLFRATVPFAPMAYATAPLTIGLFASRYRWSQPAA